jgi:hypothetical protein
MKWAGHVAGKGNRRGFWQGDIREGIYLERLGIEGRIILKWTFKE